MKLPRDVKGSDLAKKLSILDYSIVRQTGSHIRLSTERNGEHHITIPAHKNVKIGTLHSIITDIANHFQMSKNELIDMLW